METPTEKDRMILVGSHCQMGLKFEPSLPGVLLLTHLHPMTEMDVEVEDVVGQLVSPVQVIQVGIHIQNIYIKT